MEYEYPKHQPPTPVLHPVERGRFIAPEYGTNLEEFDVMTAEWTHLCSARFGPARNNSSNTKWNGDCFRYDVFRRDKSAGMIYPQYALRWWNGGGEGWLVSDDQSLRGETNPLATVAEMFEESRRWDFCHFLWQAAHKSAAAAKKAEVARLYRLFLEGRMKKRKVRGRENLFTVEIVSGR